MIIEILFFFPAIVAALLVLLALGVSIFNFVMEETSVSHIDLEEIMGLPPLISASLFTIYFFMVVILGGIYQTTYGSAYPAPFIAAMNMVVLSLFSAIFLSKKIVSHYWG